MTNTSAPDNWKEKKGFHLSVAARGLVSLWDTEEAARNAPDEVYVFLPLSLGQELMLRSAEQIAQIKTRGTVTK
jgi:hypothetical protein